MITQPTSPPTISSVRFIKAWAGVAIVEFVQKVPVAPGKYTLSFSCTKYNLSGELEALSRKYDAILVETYIKNKIAFIY